MKPIKAKIVLAASLLAGGLTMITGCAVDQNGHLALVLPTVVVAAPPPVVVAPAPVYEAPVYVAPAVVVEEPVLVPETYVVVDGVSFGVIGEQYVYLGPGEAWVVCEPWRVEHFHAWERDHHDWREHMAMRNERFRRDVHGHNVDHEGHVTDRNGHAVDRSGHSMERDNHPADRNVHAPGTPQNQQQQKNAKQQPPAKKKDDKKQ